jgi:hypothetical protein
MGEDHWCKNKCHFLVAEGIEHVDHDGDFPVFGIDCDVEVLGWGGGEVDNSTIEAYCRECAVALRKSRIEREREEEIAQEKRAEAECKERLGRERTLRTLYDHWNALSG